MVSFVISLMVIARKKAKAYFVEIIKELYRVLDSILVQKFLALSLDLLKIWDYSVASRYIYLGIQNVKKAH